MVKQGWALINDYHWALGRAMRSRDHRMASKLNIHRQNSVLPLDGIREFRFNYRSSTFTEFDLSSFPSLEVLVVDANSRESALSTVLPDPASSSRIRVLPHYGRFHGQIDAVCF